MENLEEIEPETYPKNTKKWKFPCLYSIGADTKIHSWEIGYDSDNIIIIHGTLEGKKIEDYIKPQESITIKNLNKRAYTECYAKYQKKIKKGYTSGDPTQLRLVVKPMLAGLYNPNKKLNFPVYCQVKLNGIRCLTTLYKGEVEMCSRSNTTYNYIRHIRKYIKDFLLFLPNGSYLDGELYIHDENLQEIASIVSTGNKGGDLHPKYKFLKYFIYDIDMNDDTCYEYRYDYLVKAYKKFLKKYNYSKYFSLVSCSIANDKKELKSMFNESINSGYEGLIIRKISGVNPTQQRINESLYKHNRVDNILKYKEFEDEEGTIIDVLDCKGREQGNARFVVLDERGNKFKLKMDGTFEYRKKLFLDKKNLIGKQVTYKYASLSDKGVPLHAHGICIRDYE